MSAMDHSGGSSGEMAEYGIGHAPRYDYLESVVARHLPHGSAKVLDVGASFFTLRLARRYASVSTLGFDAARDLICKMPDGMPHHVFDLNDSRDPSRWIELPKFDAIVFAEVIEHLPTAPQHVLRFLSSALAEGGLLFVQTPNATSLDKRLKLLAGLNPYELIREDWTNPGHFREYTRSELVSFAAEVGLEVVEHQYRSYFRSPRLGMKLIDLVVAPFPFLRRGQTIVLRRQVR